MLKVGDPRESAAKNLYGCRVNSRSRGLSSTYRYCFAELMQLGWHSFCVSLVGFSGEVKLKEKNRTTRGYDVPTPPVLRA